MQASSGALWVLEKLNDSGFEAYLVGGCVRDFLMQRPCSDYDVTTSALPRQILSVFDGCRTLTNGIKHGTVTVLTPEPVEVTTYRVDGAYSDSRHPDRVSFTSSIEQDLARRDFTVNAIAYHPKKGFVDPFGGVLDIKKGLLRTVGDATTRFNEDALRILRGVRFCSQLGFSMEEDTALAARKCVRGLEGISNERKYTELVKTLMGKSVDDALKEHEQILRCVLNGACLEYSLEGCSLAVRWALLLKDVCASEVLRRLRADEKTVKTVEVLIASMDCAVQGRADVKRLMRDKGADITQELITLWEALGRDVSSVKTQLDDILKNNECYSLSKLNVNGRDLKELGLSGRSIGDALELALDAVIDQKVPNTKESIIHFIKSRLKTEKDQ